MCEGHTATLTIFNHSQMGSYIPVTIKHQLIQYLIVRLLIESLISHFNSAVSQLNNSIKLLVTYNNKILIESVFLSLHICYYDTRSIHCKCIVIL